MLRSARRPKYTERKYTQNNKSINIVALVLLNEWSWVTFQNQIEFERVYSKDRTMKRNVFFTAADEWNDQSIIDCAKKKKKQMEADSFYFLCRF